MVVLAFSQSVLLLAFCLDLTVATSESFADVDQDRGDEIDSNINLNEDVDSLDSLMGCGPRPRGLVQRVCDSAALSPHMLAL